MGTSLIYEVPDSARDLLSSARSKGEWYDALGELELEDAPTFYGEESFSAWEFSISEEPERGPFSSLFVGDLRSEEDQTGDPHVAFHGASSVRALAADFHARGREFFGQMLGRCGHEAEIWLYPGLQSFLEKVASRGNGLVVLWER